MTRVRLYHDLTPDLSPAQRETFQWVVKSRGAMVRPFAVMLHSPLMARAVAELGAKVRFESSLSDHDRELVILTAAAAHSCEFEWDSHLPLAQAAGVSAEAVAFLAGRPDEPATEEALLIRFVRELIVHSTVPEDLFATTLARLGEKGVIELCVTVGYYTMLAFVMGACQAC
jgi:4-carboxymuconolactone decarboxylase